MVHDCSVTCAYVWAWTAYVMKTHRGGVRLQGRFHDTCHGLLSFHSLSLLAPLEAVTLCLVSFSLPVSASTIFFSYPAALCESEQRANSKPLGIISRFCGDYIPLHARHTFCSNWHLCLPYLL